MLRENTPDFMIIDDDNINNMLCARIITKLFPNAPVVSFTVPGAALDSIAKNYTATHKKETILLLDLNMPDLTGWDVLKEFEKFPEEVKKQFNIYILTSSIDDMDKQKAHDNNLVFGFFIKPLSDKQLESVFLVRKYKDSFIRPLQKNTKKVTYVLPDDDRRLLDKLLPYFQLKENANIKKCIRMAYENDPRTLNNMPISLHAERISSFLMVYGFANNLSGDAMISYKGIRLKEAGSLKNFEKAEAGA